MTARASLGRQPTFETAWQETPPREGLGYCTTFRYTRGNPVLGRDALGQLIIGARRLAHK